MGQYVSMFEKTESQSKIVYNPSKADWITGHADLTGLAVVEVERLWNRFKQLGPDKNGNLPKKILEKSELAQDRFTKNIINNLPKERDESLSFIVFLRFIQWAENATLDEKLKIVFNYINNGKDLDEDVLKKLFRNIYPGVPEEEIKQATEVFLTQMDDRRYGKINENQFVYNVKRLIPVTQLENILRFDIIPRDLLDDVNMQPSLTGSMLSLRNTRDDVPINDRITDEQLDLVAAKAVKKNWEDLAKRLGYLEYDIENSKIQNRGNPTATIYSMLREWRDQDPYLNTQRRLKRYLEDCNMYDAAIIFD